MKKYLIIITVILALITFSLRSQIQFLKDSLNKQTIKTEYNNGFIINYSDRLNSSIKMLPPKDSKGDVIELVSQKLISKEILKNISLNIFTEEEIKYLSKNNCFVSCLVTSSGKIISASIQFNNCNPSVNIKQLAKFAGEIREKLTFELTFNNEVNQPGCFLLTFPAFR